MAQKIIDFDTSDLLSPWEQEDIIEAKKIEDLQSKFFHREKKEQIEKEAIKKITSKKTTKKEKKELKKKAESIKNLFALDYWMRCFRRVSFHNEISGQATFHVCLGQALNTFKIKMDDDSALDWRLHYLLVQDSGSGKGKGMNFICRVFNHPNFKKHEKHLDPPISRLYKSHKLGRLNAASMINTFKTDKHGKLIQDENGFEELNLGIMQSNDFIFSEEGRQFLESSKESFEKQEIVMTGMETIGSSNNIYTKQLTDYENSCDTRCTASFLFTTRPIGKVKHVLVESGLIQRFIFYPRKLTFEDREIMNKQSSLSFKIKTKDQSFSTELNTLINELNKVILFAHKNEITFNPDCQDELLSFIYEKMMWFTRDVEENVPTEENRYILQSFVSRFKDNMIIMAFHSAAMRFSLFVDKQDLQYAFDFFKKIFEAQKIWVSLSVEEDKNIKLEDIAIRQEIEHYIKGDLNGITTFSGLVKSLSRKFNKDYNAMSYHIKKFARGSNKIIKIVKKEGEKNKVELV